MGKMMKDPYPDIPSIQMGQYWVNVLIKKIRGSKT